MGEGLSGLGVAHSFVLVENQGGTIVRHPSLSPGLLTC